MVTGVAHEMNTPLGVANTANDMITKLVDKLLSPDATAEQMRTSRQDLAEACGLLASNLRRAHQLIRSFKQLSSSQFIADRIECSLGEVVEDCVRTMQPELRKKKITIETENHLPKSILWDGFPGHLTQVIVNLIQNTSRYAYDDGGRVHLKLTTTGQSDELAYCIEFADYGNGIDERILPKVFEPFVTTGRAEGGTGLGLAISHNIVTNLLGGSISCTSDKGKGTTFVITLPAVAPSGGQATDDAHA